jgi:protein TonB
MNRFIFSRAGLLLAIAGVHVALLWALQALPHGQPEQAPQPYPVVMAEMLPLSETKQERRTARSVEPAPVRPAKPAPPKRSTPKSVPKPAPKPAAEPAPSERAVTTPQEAPAPSAAPAAQPVAAAPAAASAAEPPSMPRFDAAYLNNPAPVYPTLSRRMGEEGRVLLRVHVTADGAAGDVRLHASSGSSRLDEAAIAAVRKWRFVPAREAGAAVAAWVQVPVSFKLN